MTDVHTIVQHAVAAAGVQLCEALCNCVKLLQNPVSMPDPIGFAASKLPSAKFILRINACLLLRVLLLHGCMQQHRHDNPVQIVPAPPWACMTAQLCHVRAK